MLKIKITNRVNKKELLYELPITVVTEKQKQIYETDILWDYIGALGFTVIILKKYINFLNFTQ